MELDLDLENINKNDFLPLLSQNIKQELFDPVQEDTICDSPDKPQVRNTLFIYFFRPWATLNIPRVLDEYMA